MFEHNFEENRTRKVVIEDTKALVFKKLIEYLYTGVVSEIYDEDITVDLLVAADKYHILALKEDCSIVISRQLTTENAVPMLSWCLVLSRLFALGALSLRELCRFYRCQQLADLFPTWLDGNDDPLS